MNDCAWLVYGDLKPRPAEPRRDLPKHGFTNYQPAGVKVLTETLNRAGIEVGVVSPRAPNARVILVSLTSEQAAFKLLMSTAGHPAWKHPRKFKVVVGGFGMQNPNPIRHIADYAYFGRAESEIAEIVKALVDGKEPPTSKSLVDLRDIPTAPGALKVRQAYELFDGETYRESFVGCPLKCKFCHYTFARKHIGNDHAYSRSTGAAGHYVQIDGHGYEKNNKFIHIAEVTLPQLHDWPHNFIPPAISFGLDGASERLRFLFGKRILNSELQTGLANWSKIISTTHYKGALVHVMDILGLPGETSDDRRELARALAAAPVDMSELESFYVILRSIPFKANAWTPLQWEAFHTRYEASATAGRTIAKFAGARSKITKGGITSNAQAHYAPYLEGPGMQVMYALMTRHDGSAEADRATRYISTPRFRRQRSPRQLTDFRQQFGDFARRVLDRREIDEPLPADIIESGVPLETLRRMAHKTRADMQSNRWRGKRSIMGKLAAQPVEKAA